MNKFKYYLILYKNDLREEEYKMPNKCSECRRKLEFFKGYRHPVEGWKKPVCGNCWYKLEMSERKYTNFIKNSVKGKSIGPLCFILIKALPQQEDNAFNQLSNLPEIIELHPLLGRYDFIAKVGLEDFNKLGNFIVSKIRTIKGISQTKTLTGAFSLALENLN